MARSSSPKARGAGPRGPGKKLAAKAEKLHAKAEKLQSTIDNVTAKAKVHADHLERWAARLETVEKENLISYLADLDIIVSYCY